MGCLWPWQHRTSWRRLGVQQVSGVELGAARGGHLVSMEGTNFKEDPGSLVLLGEQVQEQGVTWCQPSLPPLTSSLRFPAQSPILEYRNRVCGPKDSWAFSGTPAEPRAVGPRKTEMEVGRSCFRACPLPSTDKLCSEVRGEGPAQIQLASLKRLPHEYSCICKPLE